VEHSSLTHTLAPLALQLTKALASSQDTRAQISGLNSHLAVLRHAMSVLKERRARMQQLINTLHSAEHGTLVPARPRKNMAPVPKIPNLDVFPDCCREGWGESARLYEKCSKVAVKYKNMEKIIGTASTLVETVVMLDQWRREAHAVDVCGMILPKRSEAGDLQGDGEGNFVMVRDTGEKERRRDREKEREEKQREREKEEREDVRAVFPQLTQEIVSYPTLTADASTIDAEASASMTNEEILSTLPSATVTSWNDVINTGILNDDVENTNSPNGNTDNDDNNSNISALTLSTRRIVNNGTVEIEIEDNHHKSLVANSNRHQESGNNGTDQHDEWIFINNKEDSHTSPRSAISPLNTASPPPRPPQAHRTQHNPLKTPCSLLNSRPQTLHHSQESPLPLRTLFWPRITAPPRTTPCNAVRPSSRTLCRC